MANKIQIRRGAFAGLPTLDSGEPALTTDTGQVYVGGVSGNIELKTAPPSADRTIYVATTALGGQTVATQGATGLELATGTATGTAANKLINSAASFTSALVNKTLYNKTDDTWAKVTAVDSPTQLTLSADVMASGEQYAIASAIDNIPEAFLRLPDGYVSNVALRISPGTFADDATFIGKNAGGNFSLSVRGSTTATTTISGKVDIRQRLALRNLTFTNKVRDFFGADVSWYTCVTSGASKLYVYSGSANYFEGSTITFGNDPGSYVAVSSTITKGYTMYVATSALGGDDAVADGLAMYSGTASATTANKLVDSTANFGTDVVGKTVYNSTDDTWAKVNARDSATQLSLSVDIMASGEAYVISNAFATRQGAIVSLPGTLNCETTIKVSDENDTTKVVIQNKGFSGAYNLNIIGTLPAASDNGTSSGANVNYSMGAAGSGAIQATLNDTSKAWGVNAHQNRLVRITGGTGAGQERAIDSNTATQLKIVGLWATLPDNTSTYKIYDLNNASRFDFAALSGSEIPLELSNQKNVIMKYFNFENWHGDYAVYTHDYSSISIYSSRFERSRVDRTSLAGVQVEAFSSMPHLESCVFIESAGTSWSRAVRLQQSASAIEGDNIKNTKIYGTNEGIVVAALSYHSYTADGHGLVIRNCRTQGVNINSFSRASLLKSIVTACTTNNVNLNTLGYLLLGADCEFSSAGGDGIKIQAQSQLNAISATTQINNNGGWGVNTVSLSLGNNVSLLSYTGNTSGTYTADASSKNT